MRNWYLSEAFDPAIEDAFLQILESKIASTAILHNHDLSEAQEIRCVIQGNTADTHIKTLDRSGLFQRNTVKAGMYLFFEDRFWLITGYPGTNGIYEKAILVLCQYKLRWQNSGGDIIERWCHSTSASRADVGETGDEFIRLSTNALFLLLPDEEECLNLHGKRVFIDKKPNPENVYEITRDDGVIYNYGDAHGGVLRFIANKTQLNKAVDHRGLGICDYCPPSFPFIPPGSEAASEIYAAIVGNRNLKLGNEWIYSAFFANSDGMEIPGLDCWWDVQSNCKIKRIIDGNRITLRVDDEALIGSTFKLSVSGQNRVLAEAEILITGSF